LRRSASHGGERIGHVQNSKHVEDAVSSFLNGQPHGSHGYLVLGEGVLLEQPLDVGPAHVALAQPRQPYLGKLLHELLARSSRDSELGLETFRVEQARERVAHRFAVLGLQPKCQVSRRKVSSQIASRFSVTRSPQPAQTRGCPGMCFQPSPLMLPSAPAPAESKRGRPRAPALRR
jgi:hypothetical protein